MTALWAGAVFVAALLLQAGISLLVPVFAPLLDLFLIITVFVCLTRGPVPGMIVGAAAAWVQDVSYGGPVLGLIGLARVLVAFAVGHAGHRFVITSIPAQAATLFSASLLDVWLLSRFAAVFEVPLTGLPLLSLLGRAVVNAVVGTLAFRLIEWRRQRELGM
jgi:hypothetical protein